MFLPSRALLLFAAAGVLLLPAQASAQESACPSRDDLGAVHGTVRDVSTSLPLQGASVSLRWQPTGPGARSEEKKTGTDRFGRFGFCDAPIDTRIFVRADFPGSESRGAQVSVGAGESVSLTLELDAAESVVMGQVLDHETNQPIAAAVVRLGGTATEQVTREDGRFQFAGVPRGIFAVAVEHVAYLSLNDTLTVEFAATLDVTIRLATHVIPVTALEVNVRSFVLQRVGFYERQDRKLGTFLTRKDIDAMVSNNSTDLLRRVAGVRIQQGRWGPVAMSRGSCPFRFIIDGARLSAAFFTLDEVPPYVIEGLEIYMGPSQVPGEFAGLSSDPSGNCGVIVVWTRNRT